MKHGALAATASVAVMAVGALAGAPAAAGHGGKVHLADKASSHEGKPRLAKKKRGTTDIQFLNVSDWHGQLDPVDVFGVGPVGGAAALSTYFAQDRAENPNTLTLTAGDAYGAAPPLSGFFDERPAVEAMRLMGFDVDGLGNHNFDRGTGHLKQMIDLAEGEDGPGEPFDYVAANVKDPAGEIEGVEPFELYRVGGKTIGVVGVLNPEAPTLVFPGNFGRVTITDPARAARKAARKAHARGADVVVAVTHMGVTGSDPVTGEAVGPLVDLAKAVKGFDVIFGDHTDVQFEKVINGALVTENRSKGLTYARTTVRVDNRTGKVLDKDAEFVTPHSGAVAPDPAIVEHLAPYRVELAKVFDTPVGVGTAVFPRGGNVERVREVAIGNLVADALRARYATQIAFTNSGGLRAALPSSYAPQDTSLRRPAAGYAPGPPFDLVTGDVFEVLPFGNTVVTRTVTGAQLWSVLEHSVGSLPGANGKFLQISGFRFIYDEQSPAGSRIKSVALDDGTPIAADQTTYTVATNDFTNTGGDGYAMLADGQGVSREVMADVVLEAIQAAQTISPVVDGRIQEDG